MSSGAFPRLDLTYTCKVEEGNLQYQSNSRGEMRFVEILLNRVVPTPYLNYSLSFLSTRFTHTNPMSLFQNPLWVLGILLGVVALSEWLVTKTVAKHLGSALLVILFGAILANLGLIPTASDQYPLYDGIFTYLAPLAIFFLMLEINLKDLKQAGIPMLVLFLVGASGTVMGVLAGVWLVGDQTALGELIHPLAGMFAGTYIGGAVNFNAVALPYNVMETGNIYAGAVAVDNILTTLWMLLTLAVPAFLQRVRPRTPVHMKAGGTDIPEFKETESLNPMGASILIGVGLLAMWASEAGSEMLKSAGIMLPSILILTSLGLLWAQFPNRLRPSGSRVLALLTIYVFLEVIGAFCDLGALGAIGEIAVDLFLLAGTTLLVHGLWIFGIGALTKWDWQLIGIASQSNVGGSTSALALAKSQNRNDLILPAILVGSLGNALGTYIGILLVEML